MDPDSEPDPQHSTDMSADGTGGQWQCYRGSVTLVWATGTGLLFVSVFGSAFVSISEYRFRIQDCTIQESQIIADPGQNSETLPCLQSSPLK